LKFILTFLTLFLCIGCVGHRRSSEQAMPSSSSYGYDADEGYAFNSKKAEKQTAYGGLAGAPPPPAAALQPPKVQQETKRMVHYGGYARLKVARVDEGIDALTALAKSLDGKVERVGGNNVTIRVPVSTFKTSFEQVLELGEVLDKQITAQDVTASFTAVELRLKTAKSTRDRLIDLLARAKDEQEKLTLVREIQRLTQQILGMESQSRTLERLAAMARITVELVPRQALAWQNAGDEAAEFAWIRQLSPFRSDILTSARKLRLTVPEGMVSLNPRGNFVAESPDGTKIWSGRMENNPLADGAFWANALQQRLEGEFASAEVSDTGGFQVLRLVERADDPYTWLIAIRPVGNHLQVIEVYYPTAAQETRYKPAVDTVISATAGGAS